RRPVHPAPRQRLEQHRRHHHRDPGRLDQGEARAAHDHPLVHERLGATMRRSLLPLVLLLAPSALAAQLPNNSTRALGLGGAYTVYARGFEAVAWNPAALGVRGRPGFTLGLPQATIEFGSSDLGFGDFRKYADKFLTAQDKADILAKIDTALGIRTIGGVTPFGLSIGRFGFSLGVAGSVDA